MKLKRKVVSMAIATAITAPLLLAPMAAKAVEGLSANVGLVSEYFYRGVVQNNTATGSAGMDYDIGNGFSVGIWNADVQDGIETDVYGSYSGEFNGFSYSIGATGYYYSGQFDVDYEEVNLNFGYGPVSLEHSIGNYDGDFDSGIAGNQQDYTFTSLTAEYNGLYALYGTWGDDADGDYIEVGYGADFSGFDVGVAYLNGDDRKSDTNNLTTPTTTLIFSIGKTFDL